MTDRLLIDLPTLPEEGKNFIGELPVEILDLPAHDAKPLTYGALRALIDRARASLNGLGIGRGDRVAIVLPNGPEMATAFLSVASAATSAPLNPAYRQEDFEFYMEDIKAKALVVEAGSASPALRAAAAFSDSRARRVVSAALTLSRGLDFLGADVPDAVGEAGFSKVNGRASLDQAIGAHVALRLRASGQWTRDPLPAVERFAVGGADFGRAFETGLINADRGYATLGELAWRPIASGRFAGSELYGFGDWSAVRVLPRDGAAGRDFDLASAGGGVRFAYTDRAMLELEYARTVDRPYAGYPSDWRISIGWRVSLRP